MENTKWQLEFYEDKRGHSDVADFIGGNEKRIDRKHVKKARRDISILEEDGLSATGIEIKELKNKINCMSLYQMIIGYCFVLLIEK